MAIFKRATTIAFLSLYACSTIPTYADDPAPIKPSATLDTTDNQVTSPSADDQTDSVPKKATEELTSEEISSARALAAVFRKSSEKALPSVVKILTRIQRGNAAPSIEEMTRSDFDSIGSGIIVSPDGVILTNNHVIQDASLIIVQLNDGRQYRSVETLADAKSDIAIVRIRATDLPTAELGDSRGLHVGDWVLAIGSPFMLESSVSAGIISGTNRYRDLSESVSGEFLQTDAAINPGNSGGPLVDLNGRVIGVNTAISSRSGGFEGIGFAIPIHRANWLRQQLEEFGRVRRGYAGVRTTDVPYSVSIEFDFRGGAYVRGVGADSPASKAGVQINDVISELNGMHVPSARSFAEIVQQSPIEQELPLVVYRDSERVELKIILQESGQTRR
ncbi:MAG: trypsin-like peptidase domain-containing protein [Planctomycetales bacterium]|nr:trypsin-like peptidase domain-containing protein [Planctomycetales bacterium]